MATRVYFRSACSWRPACECEAAERLRQVQEFFAQPNWAEELQKGLVEVGGRLDEIASIGAPADAMEASQ